MKIIECPQGRSHGSLQSCDFSSIFDEEHVHANRTSLIQTMNLTVITKLIKINPAPIIEPWTSIRSGSLGSLEEDRERRQRSYTLVFSLQGEPSLGLEIASEV